MKLAKKAGWIIQNAIFISYYPLKQGLKLGKIDMPDKWSIGFISYYPLKQGLKRDRDESFAVKKRIIYILLSIKTRIETTYIE